MQQIARLAAERLAMRCEKCSCRMNANVEYGFQPGQVSAPKTLILHAIVQEISEIVRCCDSTFTRKHSVVLSRNRLLRSLSLAKSDAACLHPGPGMHHTKPKVWTKTQLLCNVIWNYTTQYLLS